MRCCDGKRLDWKIIFAWLYIFFLFLLFERIGCRAQNPFIFCPLRAPYFNGKGGHISRFYISRFSFSYSGGDITKTVHLIWIRSPFYNDSRSISFLSLSLSTFLSPSVVLTLSSELFPFSNILPLIATEALQNFQPWNSRVKHLTVNPVPKWTLRQRFPEAKSLIRALLHSSLLTPNLQNFYQKPLVLPVLLTFPIFVYFLSARSP